MTTGTTGAMARDFEHLLGGGVAGRDDAELLERFARRGDASAFEALVLRHGPRVRGLCRRLVGDEHAAEDATQATWLVLARRARTVRLARGGSLGPWLHGVAVRVSRRARAVAAWQGERESKDAALDARPAEPGPDPAERERWAILHEEVERLPPAERAALVLCYWEGLTHREAAERLGNPSGTVNVRVKRARDRLRDRLTRRGIAGAAGLTLVDSLCGPAPAAIAVAPCVAVATRIAADGLAVEVIRTMTLSKLMKWGAAAIVSLAVSTGGMLALGRAQDAPAKPADRDDPPAAKPNANRPAAAPAKSAEPIAKPHQPVPDADDLRQTLREAAKAAEAIEDELLRGQRLAAIAPVQVQADDPGEARKTFQAAFRSLEAMPELSKVASLSLTRNDPVPQLPDVSPQRFWPILVTLDQIAQGQAEAGYFEDALASAAAIPQGKFPGDMGRDITTFRVVAIRAQKGDFDGARRSLDRIEMDQDVRLSKLGQIAQLQAKAGQVAEAKTWINEVEDPNERSLLLSNVAAGIQLRLQEAQIPSAYAK